MSNVSRNGVAFLAMVIVSAVLAGGCKEDPAAARQAVRRRLGAVGGSGSAAKVPDLSNPKSTAVSFAKAVQSNDMAAAKAASTGSDEQYKMVEAMGQMMSGFKNYESAAVAKFGDAGKSGPGHAGRGRGHRGLGSQDGRRHRHADQPQEAGRQEPDEAGEEGRQWKVDLASMPDGRADQRWRRPPRKMKKALDETAAEIKAGKYKTPQERSSAGHEDAGRDGARWWRLTDTRQGVCSRRVKHAG